MSKFVSLLMVLVLLSGSVSAFSFGSLFGDVSVAVVGVVGNAVHSVNVFFNEDVSVKSNEVSVVEGVNIDFLVDVVGEYDSDYKSGVMRSSTANAVTAVLLDEGFDKVFYKVIDGGMVVFVLEFDLRDFSLREVGVVDDGEIVVSSSLVEAEKLLVRGRSDVSESEFVDFLVGEWVGGRLEVQPVRVVNLLLETFRK
ncbi:MAG: hypothetical protein U9M89_01300 [Patescibacteria group bacterium]|nr:hypothetical protein [Patescibacteria group bacterium]